MCTQVQNLTTSCSRNRNMVCAHQNLNGSHDLTMPLSGMVYHPLATIEPYAKFEVYDHPL